MVQKHSCCTSPSLGRFLHCSSLWLLVPGIQHTHARLPAALLGGARPTPAFPTKAYLLFAQALSSAERLLHIHVCITCVMCIDVCIWMYM